MATNITGYANITTSTSTGTLINSGGFINGGGYSWVDKTEDIKDFVEFVLEILGIELKYEDFIKMSESDKKRFIRDWKINQILKNKEE